MQLKFETCVVFRLSSPPPRPRFPSQNQEEARCCPPTPLAGLCLFCASLPQKDVEKNKKPLSPPGLEIGNFGNGRESCNVNVDFTCRIFQQRIGLSAQQERVAKQRAPWVSSTRSFSSPCSCWWAFCTRPTRATRCDRLHNLPPFTAPFPLTETDPTPLPPGTSSSSSRRPWSPTAPTRPRNGSHTG